MVLSFPLISLQIPELITRQTGLEKQTGFLLLLLPMNHHHPFHVQASPGEPVLGLLPFPLDECPRAAVASTGTWVAYNERKIPSQCGDWKSKSRCQHGHDLLRCLPCLFLASFQRCQILALLCFQLHGSSFCLSCYTASSLCITLLF